MKKINIKDNVNSLTGIPHWKEISINNRKIYIKNEYQKNSNSVKDQGIEKGENAFPP